jgi:hypothetical protein
MLLSTGVLTARVRVAPCKGYRRLEGRDSPTKRTKPKATNKAILAVRIQPPVPRVRSGVRVHAVLGANKLIVILKAIR